MKLLAQFELSVLVLQNVLDWQALLSTAGFLIAIRITFQTSSWSNRMCKHYTWNDTFSLEFNRCQCFFISGVFHVMRSALYWTGSGTINRWNTYLSEMTAENSLWNFFFQYYMRKENSSNKATRQKDWNWVTKIEAFWWMLEDWIIRGKTLHLCSSWSLWLCVCNRAHLSSGLCSLR